MRNTSLLRLFREWLQGATIVAGTGVAPAQPRPDRPRVARDCPVPRCHTTVFAESDPEAARRLADHRRRCHAN